MHQKTAILAVMALVGLTGLPLPAGAQRGTSCSAETVVDALADAFEARYVLADAAAAGGRELRRALAAKRLDPDAEPEQLADRLTELLRGATGDGHVTVEWIDSGSPPAEEADWIAQWRAGAPRANYGVPRVEILPGNVGYLALRSFHTHADAAPTLRAAMTLVRHTDGLILDLRDNGGGDSETAGAVERTFLGPDEGSPLRSETRLGIDPVPAPPPLEWERYGAERPLAVLVNGRSFSAAEAVSFALASSGRATVFGSRSAGGAHMTDAATPLPCGFQGWIPNRRPFDPGTGASWEGTGVTPHVEAAGPVVVPVAHLYLLRRLREGSRDPEERARLDQLIAETEQQASPPR